MDTEIGEAAGRIWRYLAQHSEATLRQLQKETALPERCLLMGILNVRARDLAGCSILQLLFHAPIVLLLCWAFAMTL